MTSIKKLQEIDESLKVLVQKQRYNQFNKYFPDSGEFSRDKYPRHMEFIEKSQFHSIMGLLGANGSGKTTLGGYISYCHLSGLYPNWWPGYKFNMGPINGWISGLGSKQLSAIQECLFGSYMEPGTGLIPRDALCDLQGNLQLFSMPGAAQQFGICYIRHYDKFGKFDGYSKVEFKTNEQGFEQYQGANRSWIWLDEEHDSKVFAECLARTRGPQGKTGRILCTFTPTSGASELFLSFVPDFRIPENGLHKDNPQKFTMLIDDNQPHLTEEWKQSMEEEWKRTDPMNLQARKTGMAAMGSGKIFPVEEEFFVIKRRAIPDYYPRAFGLDYGYHNTAAVWVAIDPVTKIKYVYAEYKRGQVHDSMHVLAIQSKGKWIPGIDDPHSGRRDGGELRSDYYKSLGLDLVHGHSNPAAGVGMILNDLQSGQLKIMEDCEKLIKEIRTYRYDHKNQNKIAEKQDDHLIDALRYWYSKYEWTVKTEFEDEDNGYGSSTNTRFRGRDSLTGY